MHSLSSVLAPIICNPLQLCTMAMCWLRRVPSSLWVAFGGVFRELLTVEIVVNTGIEAAHESKLGEVDGQAIMRRLVLDLHLFAGNQDCVGHPRYQRWPLRLLLASFRSPRATLGLKQAFCS